MILVLAAVQSHIDDRRRQTTNQKQLKSNLIHNDHLHKKKGKHRQPYIWYTVKMHFKTQFTTIHAIIISNLSFCIFKYIYVSMYLLERRLSYWLLCPVCWWLCSGRTQSGSPLESARPYNIKQEGNKTQLSKYVVNGHLLRITVRAHLGYVIFLLILQFLYHSLKWSIFGRYICLHHILQTGVKLNALASLSLCPIPSHHELVKEALHFQKYYCCSTVVHYRGYLIQYTVRNMWVSYKMDRISTASK